MKWWIHYYYSARPKERFLHWWQSGIQLFTVLMDIISMLRMNLSLKFTLFVNSLVWFRYHIQTLPLTTCASSPTTPMCLSRPPFGAAFNAAQWSYAGCSAFLVGPPGSREQMKTLIWCVTRNKIGLCCWSVYRRDPTTMKPVYCLLLWTVTLIVCVKYYFVYSDKFENRNLNAGIAC